MVTVTPTFPALSGLGNLHLTSPQLEFLKHFALVLMTAEHAGLALEGLDHWLRAPGRLVIPILAILLAYNYQFHTRNASAYSQRLLLFAVISQWPFIYLTGYPVTSLNILFDLWAGILLLQLHDADYSRFRPLVRFLIFEAVAIGLVAMFFLQYIMFTVALVVYFAGMLLRSRSPYRAAWLLPLCLSILAVNGMLGWWMSIAGVMALPVIYLVSRVDIPHWPRIKGLWFYFYYPVHMVILKAVL